MMMRKLCLQHIDDDWRFYIYNVRVYVIYLLIANEYSAYVIKCMYEWVSTGLIIILIREYYV